MPATVTAAVMLCMKLYIYDSCQDAGKRALPPPVSSSDINTGLFTPLTGFPYSPFFLSIPYSSFSISFCTLPLLIPPASQPPHPTSIVGFRQAIYIVLPGCLTSHPLNKVFFIGFARVYVHVQCMTVCLDIPRNILCSSLSKGVEFFSPHT